MSDGNSIIARIAANIDPLMKDLKAAEFHIKRQAQKMQETATMLSTRVSLPILGVGAAVVKSAADFERYSKGLEAIMGDATKATRELGLLRDIAENPGLSFEQAVKGSVRLQAVGFSADESRRSLGAFANALALVGGTAVDLDGVNLAISQIVSKGKVQAEEINQIAERVPQIRKAMQDAFGTADTEQIQKMGLSAKEFVNRVVVEMEKLPKAADTLSNSFDNVRQSVWFAMVSIGDSINEAFDVQGKVKAMTAWINRIVDGFNAMDAEVKKTILTIAGIAAAIGPVMLAVSQLKLVWGAVISTVTSLISLLNPTTLIIAAIAATVYTVYKNWALVKVQLASTYNSFVDMYNGSLLFRGVVEGLQTGFKMVWAMVKGIANQLLNMGKFTGLFIKGLLTFDKDLIVSAMTAGFSESVRLAKETGDEMGAALADGINATLGKEKLEYITPDDIQAGIDNVVGKVKGFFFSEAKEGTSEGIAAGVTDAAESQGAGGPSRRVASLGPVQTLSPLGITPGMERMQDLMKEQEFMGKNLVNIYGGWSKAVEDLASEYAVFGDEGDFLSGKIENQKQLIIKLIEDGFGPYSDAVQKAKEALDEMMEKQKEFNLLQEVTDQIQQSVLQSLADGFMTAGIAIGESLATAGKGMVGLANVLKATVTGIMRSLYQIITAMLIKDLFAEKSQFGLGWIGTLGALAAMGTAMGVVTGMLNKAGSFTPKLATGGLAFGETLAMVGDNPNARIDPEVIAPLSKLKQFMGNGGSAPVTTVQRIEIEGDKLVILLESVNRKYKARRGYGIDIG